MTRFGSMVRRVDERIPGIDLPLMSVSQTRGVIRRSELTDKPPRAETLDVYKVCRAGDVVFNKMSIRAGALGVAREDGLITYHYEVMRPNNQADARYLVYLVKSAWFTGELVSRERGIGAGGQANVRTTEVPFSVLRTIDAYIPDLSQQERLADFLDRETAQFDELIDKQTALIELLGERRKAVITQAVTKGLDPNVPMRESDVEWLGELPAHWRIGPLKRQLTDICNGLSPQAEVARAEEADAWGVLKSGCVNRGWFDDEQHKRLPSEFVVPHALAVRKGDVLVCRASGSRDLVGSCARVDRLRYKLMLSDKIFRLDPAPQTDPAYLAWLLNSQPYRAQVATAISGAEGLANNLPSGALKNFLLPIPPVSEQAAIAERLDATTAKISDLIVKTRLSVDLLRERRSALITAAVTGKIDVRGAA